MTRIDVNQESDITGKTVFLFIVNLVYFPIPLLIFVFLSNSHIDHNVYSILPAFYDFVDDLSFLN